MGSSPDEKASGSNRTLLDEHFEFLREQLRQIASQKAPGYSLSPTALINELYIKLSDAKPVRVNDAEHFLALAATAMRQIVIDRFKYRATQKRGGGWNRTVLDQVVDSMTHTHGDLVELDGALSKLAEFDARKARLVELRFFGQLTLAEAAAALEISEATAKRDWVFAKGWLYRHLAGEGLV